MRQPTLLARAAPRLLHQVYSTASGFATRKLSFQPRAGGSTSPSPCPSAIIELSQARSDGRQPEFFWLLVQFLMSLRARTMFQSPHSTYSRPLASHWSRIGLSQSITSNLKPWRNSPDDPEGM